MKTTEVTFKDLHSSVIAVPPLARTDDLRFDKQGNAALIRHLERGNVSTIMYGGNANFYNVSLSEYASLLSDIVELAGESTWIIPSAGPSYGMFMDQAEILEDFDFPTAMVLPMTTATTSDGVESGLRRFAEKLGKKIIIYLKQEGYLTTDAVKRLVDDGLVCAVKYAVVRPDPSKDDFLGELCEAIDKRMIISGIGERPAVTHFRDFGLNVFTSGSVCVAPRQSTQLLHALHDKDYAAAAAIREKFLPLEDLRDAINPIRVLHDAVTLADVADMGPILPLASNLDEQDRKRVAVAARELATAEHTTV